MFISIITMTSFLSWIPIVHAQEYNPLGDVYDMTLLTLVPLFITTFQVLKKRLEHLKDNDAKISGRVDLLIVFLLTGLIPNIPLFIRPLRNGLGFFLPIIISYTVFPMIGIFYLMDFNKFQLRKPKFKDLSVYVNGAFFLIGVFQLATSFTLIIISWWKHKRFDNNIIFLIPVIILYLTLYIKILLETSMITFGWFFSVPLNLVTSTLLYSTSYYEVKTLFFTIIFCFIKLCDHLFIRLKPQESSVKPISRPDIESPTSSEEENSEDTNRQ